MEVESAMNGHDRGPWIDDRSSEFARVVDAIRRTFEGVVDELDLGPEATERSRVALARGLIAIGGAILDDIRRGREMDEDDFGCADDDDWRPVCGWCEAYLLDEDEYHERLAKGLDVDGPGRCLRCGWYEGADEDD